MDKNQDTDLPPHFLSAHNNNIALHGTRDSRAVLDFGDVFYTVGIATVPHIEFDARVQSVPRTISECVLSGENSL
jgi:hypothetical protein